MENGSYFLNQSTLIQTLHGRVWDWEVKITFVSLLITNLHCLNSNPVLVPEYKIFLDSWPKPWESLACFYTIHTLTLIKSNICPKTIWMQLWLPPFCIPPYFSLFLYLSISKSIFETSFLPLTKGGWNYGGEWVEAYQILEPSNPEFMPYRTVLLSVNKIDKKWYLYQTLVGF